MKYTLLLLLNALILAACSPYPAPNWEEIKKESQRFHDAYQVREYHHKTPKEVADAAKEVTSLWDGEHVTFKETSFGFVATRRPPSYYSFVGQNISDSWDIKVQPASDGTGVVIEVTLSSHTATYNPGIMIYQTLPTSSKAIYTLFWKRMDYLLGQSSRWPTCKEFQEELKTMPEVKDTLDPFCNRIVKDNLPENLNSRTH